MAYVANSGLERFQVHRDLAALIDLYESSFFRLRQLAPELDAIDGTVVSRVSGALDLHLTVMERHRYTTTVNLTYRFRDDDQYILEPNARLCVYHDVRAVEVVSHCRRKRTRPSQLPWRRGRMPEVDRKWEMNRFLLKWLKFCAHQGHLFLGATTSPAPDVDRLVRMTAAPVIGPT